MDIEKEIELIKQRNKKVEADKKWEKSWIRIAVIVLMTYSIVLLYSYLLDINSSIFLSAAVPVLGFFLSTLSLNALRKFLQKKDGQ